jgi:UDP-glucose 4-epimerase
LGFSVREVFSIIAATTGRTVPYVIKLRRNGDPAELVAIPVRARKLGLAVGHSDLNTIVDWAWRPRPQRVIEKGSTEVLPFHQFWFARVTPP